MAAEFKYLFTPLKIGPVTVRNRLYISAHTTLHSDQGQYNLFSERDAYYFAERAKGGVGLIITTQVAVHPLSHGRYYNIPVGYVKEIIPRYRMIADMVHQHGGKIFVQLNHSGLSTDTGCSDDWRRVMAPSSVVEWAKEMDHADIEEAVEAFAKCAEYVREGGMDGIELHGGPGYLLKQFWSPLYNKRT